MHPNFCVFEVKLNLLATRFERKYQCARLGICKCVVCPNIVLIFAGSFRVNLVVDLECPPRIWDRCSEILALL